MQRPAISRGFEQQLEAYSATSKSITSASNWREGLCSWPIYAAATASALACATSASAGTIYRLPVNISVSLLAGNAHTSRFVGSYPIFMGMSLSHSSKNSAIRFGRAGLNGATNFGRTHLDFKLLTSRGIVRPLASNAVISSQAGGFAAGGELWGDVTGGHLGGWGPGADQTEFAGFKLTWDSSVFDNTGGIYGWLRLSVKDLNGDGYPDQITLIDFAYNNVIGQSINAGESPEPTTKAMMLLAAGFAGVLAWRKRKTAV